ncbi:MAG: RnfABCDGE type electron transport complex subunit G [Anaerovoracaceae bacterium]
MKNNTFKNNIAPALVLVLICLVITAALAATYNVASPIIEANTKKAADEARGEVLPKGDSFKQYDGKLAAGVTECYMADNKEGMVVTSTAKSYGGTMTVMVGIDKTGKMTGVKVTGHADTPGLGTKAMTPEYLAQYKGLDKTEDKASIKDDKSLDAIVGATISSNGVYQNIKEALQQYKECGGVK